MMIPTVHLNGTSKASLLEQLANATGALVQAQRALTDAMPHDRDYYPQSGSAGPQARLEHQRRLALVQSVIDELTAIAEGVYVQGKR